MSGRWRKSRSQLSQLDRSRHRRRAVSDLEWRAGRPGSLPASEHLRVQPRHESAGQGGGSRGVPAGHAAQPANIEAIAMRAPAPSCRVWPCSARAVYRGLCARHARTAERQRGSARSRGYDSDWERARAHQLKQHPFCVDCGRPATDVDHIQSVREAPHRRLDPANLRSMCHRHHSRRTARDQSGWPQKVKT